MDKKMNVLIIANKMVFPALDGGSLAMQNLCEILEDLSYAVDLVAISKKNNFKSPPHPITSHHQKQVNQILFEKNMRFNFYVFIKSFLCGQSYQASRFYDTDIKNYIQKLIDKKKYPIIIFESIFTTIYFEKLKIPKSTKTILRAHNIEHKIWEDLAYNQKIKKLAFLFLAQQLKNMERTTPKNIDYIFTLSQTDNTFFQNIFPTKTYNIPVTFKIIESKFKKQEHSIFHLGAMDWKPNLEGIDWFFEKVKPLIKNSVKIYIAGKSMPPRYMHYKQKNIIVSSKVENAQKYAQNKEILFVPLLSGSGIRIKILESMSLGIPVISTSQGADGIPYTHGENILIANHPDDFANAIHRLIENKKLAQKIGENGKQLIRKHFSKKYAINKWKKIIN